jgi:hypothetical protein
MISNPFAARHIRPGAIPFLFLDGDSAEAIVQRLSTHHWRGQIVGNHGSGKSTLLATLAPLLEAAGRSVHLHKVGPGESILPAIDHSTLSPATQFIIDGYEQLSWSSRLRIRWLTWRRRAGLLITAHADVGFPTVYATKPSEAVAAAVVSSLTATDSVTLSADQISAAFRAAGGNVRETLFRLFDLCQSRRTTGND